MLELFDAGSDGFSDEPVAGSPVPSSLAKPDNSSFDEPFPFPVDKSDDPSIPGSADTSVISADAPSEKSGHAPIVRKRPLKLRPSILKKPRSDSKQVGKADPFKFVREDQHLNRFDADESLPAFSATEQSLSRAVGSKAPSVTFSGTTTEYSYTAYDSDEDPSHKLDLDGTEGDLKSEAEVSLNPTEGMSATEATARFEEKRRKAEQYEVQETEKSEESAERKRVEVVWNRSKWVNNAAVSSDLVKRREIANQLIIIESELWLPINNMKGGHVLRAARVQEVKE
jgi:hypothetical protein